MTVYGIGLGPGGADLVTVKGRRLLELAVVIYSSDRLLRTVALNHIPEGRIGDLGFPMTCDPNELRRMWKRATAEVTACADSGDVAFVTLGGPNVYPTLGHLRRTLDVFHLEVDLGVVFGVSAMTAFMTALGAEIESGTGLAFHEAANGAAPTGPDRVVLFKVTDAPAIHEKLTEADYDVCFGRRLFMGQDETVVTDDPDELAECDYYTPAYAERESTERDVAAAEFDDVGSGRSA